MTTKERKRPEIATDEHFEFLDELRETEEMNMFGAGPHLRARFGLDRDESHEILDYWMHTPREER